jgi:hypothetical protein
MADLTQLLLIDSSLAYLLHKETSLQRRLDQQIIYVVCPHNGFAGQYVLGFSVSGGRLSILQGRFSQMVCYYSHHGLCLSFKKHVQRQTQVSPIAQSGTKCIMELGWLIDFGIPTVTDQPCKDSSKTWVSVDCDLHQSALTHMYKQKTLL